MLLRHLTDLQLLQTVPRILHVGILRTAIALQFQMTRHTHPIEAALVEVFPPVIRGSLCGAGGILHPPLAAQAALEGACAGLGLLRVSINCVIRIGSQAIDRKDPWIVEP